MTPQQEIDDLKRRIDEMERATRYYPPIYPPGYTPPPTAPYTYPPCGHLSMIVYCAVMH